MAHADHTRDPCPWVILSDFGSAFAMGAIGGTIWHGIKGARNSPRGDRLVGAMSVIKARAPVTGGNFGVWGGMFSTFDCAVKGWRQKEDMWNAIISGFLTGGCLAARSEFNNLEISGHSTDAMRCGIYSDSIVRTAYLPSVASSLCQCLLHDANFRYKVVPVRLSVRLLLVVFSLVSSKVLVCLPLECSTKVHDHSFHQVSSCTSSPGFHGILTTVVYYLSTRKHAATTIMNYHVKRFLDARF
ncbi:translocase of the inner membrane, variant 2 [Taiwanofungus camphoratus]|nr:translocase of the inner membrane, variant 2 [Antrodia cinnamomea]